MTTKSSDPRKTILLVEDEGIVLLSLQMGLEEFGYQVITALNGADALQQYAQHKDEIALVLTDMTMPGMDGLALLEALRAQSPQLKIILMTGHLLDTDSLSLRKHKPTRRVMKPIGINELSRIIKETLA